jgi:predicted nucleic acid-binding protein
MRFWDSSALVPLLILEPSSQNMRALIHHDAEVVASFITAVEVSSAVWRRLHNGKLGAAEHAAAEEQFAALSNNWWEENELRRIIDLALDLLRRHPLRAADAIQLASAIAIVKAARIKPSSLPFVTLDGDLADAARAEGFPVLP